MDSKWAAMRISLLDLDDSPSVYTGKIESVEIEVGA